MPSRAACRAAHFAASFAYRVISTPDTDLMPQPRSWSSLTAHGTHHPGPAHQAPPHLPPDFQRDASPSCTQPASRSMSSNTNLLRPRRFDGLDGLIRVLRCCDCSPLPILRFESFQGEPRLTATPSPQLALPGPSELSPRRPPCRVTATPAFSPFLLPRHRVTAIPDGWEGPLLGSTSRLSSSDESVVQLGVAAALNPLLSWASFPSKAFPD